MRFNSTQFNSNKKDRIYKNQFLNNSILSCYRIELYPFLWQFKRDISFFEIWSSDAVDLNIYKCIELNDSRWYTLLILVWVYPKTGVRLNQGWKWPFFRELPKQTILSVGRRKKIIFWMSFQKFGLCNGISPGSPLEKKNAIS